MQITVTDAILNGAPASGIPEAAPGRKQLIVANTGAQPCYYGWELETRATGTGQGIPLEAGAVVTFAGADLDLRTKLYLICATGQTTTVNYTQKG